MRVLVLGGTTWLGHAVADVAIRGGHHVTCVARGDAVPEGAALVQTNRDDSGAFTSVVSSRWDAVIDVARQPGHVRRAVHALEPVTDRFVFVSSSSVYASQAEVGADEDAPLLDPLRAEEMSSPADYGSAKVACEQAVLEGFGAQRSEVVRPGLIGGPGDSSGRTGYWGLRFAKPSNPERRVLVPDAPDLPTAVIDVRDLAEWIIRVVEQMSHGTFNAVGDPLPFPEHIETARSVAGHDGPIALATQDWLLGHGVAEWSGARSLPLWLVDRSWYGMNARSNARARTIGLATRPLSETLADSLRWDLDHSVDPGKGAGLTDDEERELLGALCRALDCAPGDHLRHVEEEGI